MNSRPFEDFAQAISSVYEIGEARYIARIVREDVFAHQTILSEKELKQLNEIKDKLLDKQPIQYVLGVADFYGLKLKVDKSVLIPRQDTETLVHEVILLAQARKGKKLSILDIGTGSGCIALALKKALDLVDVTAVDVSIPALNLARHNNQINGLCVQFEQMDILNEANWARMPKYDIIVSNPPYIPPSEKALMPDIVTINEPSLALFIPEEDPMLFYRKIGQFALSHLSEKGMLVFEINEFRATQTVDVLVNLGYQFVAIKQDLTGADRVVIATKPFPQGAKKAL